MPDKIAVIYDKKEIEIDLSGYDDLEIYEFGPNKVDVFLSDEQIFDVFEKADLKERLKEKQGKLIIAVNDDQREPISAMMLGYLDEYLQSHANLTLEELHAIGAIATGTHTSLFDENWTFIESKIRELLGKYYDKFDDVLVHNGHMDLARYENLGTTRRGTPIYVNQGILRQDALFLDIGQIKPHYFMGREGTIKKIAPGFMSRETTAGKNGNHLLAMEDGSEFMNLTNNPVREDAKEIVRITKQHMKEKYNMDILSISTVINKIDGNKKVAGVHVGDILEELPELINVVKKIYCVEIDKKADVLIASPASPADENIYQALKAFEAQKNALNTGGVMDLIASCKNGFGGKPNRRFYEFLERNHEKISYGHIDALINEVRGNYAEGAHKGVNVAKKVLFEPFMRIFLASEGLTDNEAMNCFMKPYNTKNKIEDVVKQSIYEAIECAPKRRKKKILFNVREASEVILMPGQSQPI